MSDLPTHRSEHTGNAPLDRIQNNVRALIEYVRGIAWLARRAYAALETDTGNVAAGAYATIVTASVSTALAASFLVITATASGVQNTAAGTVFLQVLVDGVVVKGCYTTVTAAWSWNLALTARVAVSQGPHVVLLQWKTNNATARINAKTANEEHAVLRVHEEAP